MYSEKTILGWKPVEYHHFKVAREDKIMLVRTAARRCPLESKN